MQRILVNDGSDQGIPEEWRPDVHVQRLAPGVYASPANDHIDILDAGAAEKYSGLAEGYHEDALVVIWCNMARRTVDHRREWKNCACI